MSKLLTKEQADWLIEKLDSIFPSLKNNNITVEQLHKGSLENGAAYVCNKMREFINQCTEKEFPEFRCANLSITYDGDNAQRFIKLQVGDLQFPDVTKWLNVDELKQFTQGCQKICEWLGQE